MAEIVYVLSGEIAWFDFYRKYGDVFDKPLQRSITLLEEFPEMGPIFEIAPFRRLIVSQTSWGIFYVIEGNRVVIHTILDLRQDPNRIRQSLIDLLS